MSATPMHSQLKSIDNTTRVRLCRLVARAMGGSKKVHQIRRVWRLAKALDRAALMATRS